MSRRALWVCKMYDYPTGRNYSKSLPMRLLEINNFCLHLLFYPTALLLHLHRVSRVGELSGQLSMPGCLT